MSEHINPTAANRVPEQKSGASRQLVRRGRDLRTAGLLSMIVVGMLGMSYAAVPLYEMFCRVTGYGGTTKRADAPSATTSDRLITVRFNSHISPSLNWRFRPIQQTMQVRLGETALAIYTAENLSSEPLTGTATFNVTPEISGSFFNKIECFCFTEQRLEPGQKVDMPVQFFIDPEILADRSAKGVKEITLSYTFFPVEEPKASTTELKPRNVEGRTGENAGPGDTLPPPRNG